MGIKSELKSKSIVEWHFKAINGYSVTSIASWTVYNANHSTPFHPTGVPSIPLHSAVSHRRQWTFPITNVSSLESESDCYCNSCCCCLAEYVLKSLSPQISNKIFNRKGNSELSFHWINENLYFPFSLHILIKNTKLNWPKCFHS